MSRQNACFICCAPEAAILCPECGIARYCSETCQHVALVERHHAITLCPQLRDFHRSQHKSNMDAIKEGLMQSRAPLAVRIEYRGALLEKQEDMVIYEWYRDIMLNQLKVNPTLPAINVHDNMNLISVTNAWFKQHGLELRKYVQFVKMNSDINTVINPSPGAIKRLGLEDAYGENIIEQMAPRLLDIFATARANGELPPVFPSFLEQFWLVCIAGIRPYYHRVREQERIDRRVAEDIEALQDSIRAAKRRRIYAFTQHHTPLNFNDFPEEIYWHIAFFWPARTVLDFFNLDRKKSALYGAKAVDLLIKRDFLEPLGPITPTVKAFLPRYNDLTLVRNRLNKLSQAKQTFITWLLVSSVLADLDAHLPEAMAEEDAAMMTNGFGTITNWLKGMEYYDGSILRLYYKSVAYTMAQSFFPTRMVDGKIRYLLTSRLDIIGASGLHIRGLFNKDVQHFELLSETFTEPLNSPLELAVASRVFRLNALIEEDVDDITPDYRALLLFLIGSVDPTVEVWENFDNTAYMSGMIEYDLLVPQDVSFFGVHETRWVAPSCTVSGLGYGARYRFDTHPAYGAAGERNAGHPLLKVSERQQTLGALINEGWDGDSLGRFIGLDYERIDAFMIADAASSSDEDDNMDDG